MIDVYRYEVSPGVLQHLAATLQKLSRAGRTGLGRNSTLGLGGRPTGGSWRLPVDCVLSRRFALPSSSEAS